MHVLDIKSMADPEAVARYMKKLVVVLAARFPDILSTCPGGCGHVMPPKKDRFDCPTCDVVWCTSCKQPEHSGFCISRMEDDWKALTDEAEAAGMRSCPTCKTPYDKDNQCAHVKCEAPMCETHFCWGCCVGFSNSTTSPDAHVRVVEITGNIATVALVENTWAPEGNKVPLPTRKLTVQTSKLRTVDGTDDDFWFPTYVYDHINICGKHLG
jgi:hypothetical protein